MSDVTPSALGSSALAGDLSFLIARANALSITAGNAALADLGLKVRSYSVLALAAAATSPTQREIAEVLRLDPSQVVTLVDGLQQAGLVERRTVPHDRRANVIVATSAGEDLLTRGRVVVLEAERAVHASLDDDERATLAALLLKLSSED